MESQGRQWRGCLAVGLAGVALAIGGGASASAFDRGEGGGSASGQPASMQLGVETGSDAAALRSGEVEVTASARQRRVKLFVTSARGGPRMTRVRSVALNRGENRLSLPLNRAGREVLDACGAKRLTVHARSTSGRRLRRASQSIDRTVPQCETLAKADRCETIAAPGSNCLFPWPSNHFTVRKRSSATGREVNLDLESMPQNRHDVHVDPTELNRSDGFSPGVSIVTHIPGLDTPEAFQRTGAVPLTDMEQAFRPRQPIVLIDAKTGRRQLIWSELDANATSPENTDLIIRVGKNLKEGHRYIVAMRRLKDANGDTIPAPPGFAVYRDRLKTDVPAIEKRRHHFERIFKTLRKKAGIHRGNLYGAWDFTVASTRNITGRMLHIRNDGLAQLGDKTPGDGIEQGDAPQFTVTDVKTVNEPNPRPGHEDLKQTDPEHAIQNVREVTGTFEVPCYLDQPGCPSGSRYNLGADGLPRQMPGNTYTANFTCNIPRSAVHQTSPGSGEFEVVRKDRTSMYGHGLFGDAGEVHTENVRQLGDDHNVITCATDWIGMAEEDVGPEAVPALLDLSNFPPLPDRLQQGFLDFVYLGRLMSLSDGFASNAAFRFGGKSPIDLKKGVFYYGNSQGGIAGGALTAIEPDITRTVLYVPGMNYSTLLTRSVDFEDYATILYPSYPVESERPLLISMIQMMWDRGEPDGYANHMTDDPLPRTPAHKVLIEMAYADHQVSNVATEVEARTIGAPLRRPTVDAFRIPDPFVDFFPRTGELGPLMGAGKPRPASHGNGFFVWDIGPKRPDGSGGILGTDPAPITNTAPNDSYGVDPHDTVIDTSPAVRKQIAAFIKPHGRIVPVCGHHPCYAAGWHGP
jgi:hypothetical protein